MSKKASTPEELMKTSQSTGPSRITLENSLRILDCSSGLSSTAWMMNGVHPSFRTNLEVSSPLPTGRVMAMVFFEDGLDVDSSPSLLDPFRPFLKKFLSHLSRQDNSVKFAPLYFLNSCIHVSPDRFRFHVRPSAFKLSDTEQTARTNPSAHFHIFQQAVSLAHQHIGNGPPLGNASYQKPAVLVEDRNVLHTVNCEVNLTIEDCLVDFFFEDSFLVEREEGGSLVSITGSHNDFPVYF